MTSPAPQPIHSRVLTITHDPHVPRERGRRLHEVLRWNDPEELARRYVADVREASHGLVRYEIVAQRSSDSFPAKLDGFAYSVDSYLASWRARSGFHHPDAVDYHRLLAEFDVIPQINSGAIDEVWLFGFPYAGYYESIMVGPGAFWCNAPPLDKTDNANRRFVIMGYNYQRGRGEMLENHGHRAESILTHVFRHLKGDENLYERFTRYDQKNPGQAEVGIVHYAPNSVKDYDWGNKTKVKSKADNWKNFPNLAGEPRVVDDKEWGSGDTLAHHIWWFQHMPHITGGKDGVAYNWMKYVVDPNTVR